MPDKNKKSKSGIFAGVAILVVALLILSSIFVYYEYFAEKEVQEKKEEVKIDDRISPLENQGVVIEVLRIRHRGLYDKLTKTRRGWKAKPTFFFVTNMDGLEYASNVVGQHGRFEEINFHTWDTMFMERKIVKDSEEEQEKSEITLTIIEKITKRKLIRKTTKDVERDSFTVKYDYRTGRWSGDDNFNDKDGYGHYLGDTFEIWFNIYQIDSDGDFIPYWTEVNVLGTDPRRDDTNRDPDGDGCPTAWEWKWGYDPFTWDDHEKLDPECDGIENIEEYQMEKWLANPYHQEVYVEIDSVAGSGRFDPPSKLYEESAQAITEKYAEHYISIFFDTGWRNGPVNGGGEILPYYEKLSQDSGMILEYYNNYFPEERRGIFRYLVFGHKGGFNIPAKNNVYDCTYVPHDPLIIYKPYKGIKNFFMYGGIPTARGNRVQLAAACMHELGHSNGIGASPFEGVDNYSYGLPRFPNKNYLYKDYRSVMNYQCIYDYDVLDYSDGRNGPPYDQNDWQKMFIANFEYNDALIEEPFFEPPGHDKYVFDGLDPDDTGYILDENLTQKVIKLMSTYSPVDPITVEWAALRLVEADKYPELKEIKILVKPNVPDSKWVQYSEGELDIEGNLQFYSQDTIVNNILEELKQIK
jgi:hypothetical protein